MPALTVREILTLDVLGPAAPVLLAGRSGLEGTVRRVHSGDASEGRVRLHGGELLLTNGYWLAGVSAERQRGWVRELAARAAAALFVEVGRALPRMPRPVAAECERVGLPLVALRRVVPFGRMAEALNGAIVSNGALVPPPAERTAGRVPGDAPAVRSGAGHARALLADLVDGVPVGRSDAAARAALAGFRPPPGHRLLGLAARGLPAALPARVAASQPGRPGAAALVAELSGGVFALVAVVPGPDPVHAVRDALRAAAPAGAVAGLGPAVPVEGGWERYGESLREAVATLGLAATVPPAEPDRPGPGEAYVTTARALALERELTRSGGRERWSRLAEDALGPLLAWEARHPSDLVRTLEVHLRHGCSPTRTAALLHIGRQSLYQRLERIERLLGVEVADPDAHAELLLAACAFRLLRAGADRPLPGRRPARARGGSGGGP